MLQAAQSLADIGEWGQLSKLLKKSEALSKLMESRIYGQLTDFADLGKCYCLLGNHYLYSLKAAVRMGERVRLLRIVHKSKGRAQDECMSCMECQWCMCFDFISKASLILLYFLPSTFFNNKCRKSGKR